MAMKDKFGNKGLYRLWLVLSVCWIIFFFANGVGTTVKIAFYEYEKSVACEKASIAHGWYDDAPYLKDIKCQRGINSREITVAHNGSLQALLLLVTLIGPSLLSYYGYRLLRWVALGFFEK